MEEATENTEAAAAATTARRARYAHLLIVYELQFEHSARQSAPAIELNCRALRKRVAGGADDESRAPSPVSRMSQAQGWSR
jgi:hypothetical protein